MAKEKAEKKARERARRREQRALDAKALEDELAQVEAEMELDEHRASANFQVAESSGNIADIAQTSTSSITLDSDLSTLTPTICIFGY